MLLRSCIIKTHKHHIWLFCHRVGIYTCTCMLINLLTGKFFFSCLWTLMNCVHVCLFTSYYFDPDTLELLLIQMHLKSSQVIDPHVWISESNWMRKWISLYYKTSPQQDCRCSRPFERCSLAARCVNQFYERLFPLQPASGDQDRGCLPLEQPNTYQI